MGILWNDLRFGARGLLKDLRFSMLAILALALGIASTAVIFSVTDSILVEPYPYKHQERMTVIYVHDSAHPKEDGRTGFRVPEFMDILEQSHVFEGITGLMGTDVLYQGKDQTQIFRGGQVTFSRFDVTDSRVLLGRAFTADDDRPGSTAIFCMSDKLWASQFNRDPSIIGKTFVLNGQPRTLLGVIDARFLPNEDDIVFPAHLSRDNTIDPNGNFPIYYQPLATLKEGVSLKTATAELDTIIRRRAKIYPKEYPQNFTVKVRPLTDLTAGAIKSTLYLLMGAVAMLLLIACSNVGNLLLARATVREREISIRASLGATRGRIVRQLLLESFLLSAVSCVAGCALAYLGLKLVANTIPRDFIPTQAEIRLHPVILWFAVAITFVPTLLCGLVPALHASRIGLASSLNDAGKGVNTHYGHKKLRAALVVTEVALSILLLASAGFMMRRFIALERQDLGFNPSNILFARTALPAKRYDTAQQKEQFFRQTLQRIRTLPGVISAATSFSLPPYSGARTEVTIPGKTHPERWESLVDLCGESYLRTVGLRLLSGEFLSEADVTGARHVAVINELLARSYFGGENPIGKTIKFNFFDQLPDAPHDAYFEIKGVMSNSLNQGLQNTPMPAAIVPFTVTGVGTGRALLIRTAMPPLGLVPSIRREIFNVDSAVAITDAGTVEGYMERYQYAAPQFGLLVLGCFAGIGLVLVAIGVFSVMAYTVSLQTHDIGVRMALGAQQQNVYVMVLGRGMRLIVAGILFGLLATIGLARILANQFSGFSPTDPWTFSIVAVIVGAVGLAACFFPARRATRVDPLVALRYE